MTSRRDEEGMAMITAVLVGLVVLFLGVVATGLSDHSFSSTRVDLKRVTTVHAAEAGIDAALEVLQSEPRATLPCGAPLARSLGGGNYAADFLVTFAYYAVYPVAGTPMTCPLAAEPAAVVIRSDGDSSDPSYGRRSIEVTAQLSVPTGLGAFDRAVLSDTAIEYDGGAVFVSGNGADNAIIQTNAAYNCDQPQQLAGSVYARTTVTMSSSCSVNRDVWAEGNVSL